MGLVSTILMALGLKLGLETVKSEGFMPQSTYVRQAMEALKKDDLSQAIASYRLAVKRHRPSDLTDMTAEQIRLRIHSHINRLEARLEEVTQMLPKGFLQTLWQRLAPARQRELDELRQEKAHLEEGIAILRGLERRLDHLDL